MKDKKKEVLNQHSALTTFKLKKGKYYKVGVEKSIFALLLRAQKDMKKSFKEIFEDKLDFLELDKNQFDNIFEKTLMNKEIEVDMESIDKEDLIKIASEIRDYHEEKIRNQTSDEQEFIGLSKEIEGMALTKVVNSKKQLFLNPKEVNNFFDEIKNYCKDLTIDKYIDAKTVDFTILANKIGTNSTLLKKEIKKAVGTVLEFNYINKKNIDIEIISSLISSVRFSHDKKGNRTWMSYQIPREVLQLLLMPKMYVPLDGLVISEISGPYTYRMYSLFKDHIKRKMVELTKEELFNFFDLPASYRNKTNLVKKFLEPASKETEKVSGIRSRYTFLPKNAWKSIRFDIEVVKDVDTEEINIVTREDNITIWQNKKILEKIEKAKKNIYVSKAWNKRAENKISKVYMEEGENYTLFILEELYKGLQKDIKTTLVQYINGIMKNVPNTKDIQKEAVENEDIIMEAQVVEEKKEEIGGVDELLYQLYEKMIEEEKNKIEEIAKELFKDEIGIETIGRVEEKIFEKTKKSLIIRALKEAK